MQPLAGNSTGVSYKENSMNVSWNSQDWLKLITSLLDVFKKKEK